MRTDNPAVDCSHRSHLKINKEVHDYIFLKNYKVFYLTRVQKTDVEGFFAHMPKHDKKDIKKTLKKMFLAASLPKIRCV